VPPEIAKGKKNAQGRGYHAARFRTAPEDGEHDEHQARRNQEWAEGAELDHPEP
jgi:hypothetical protein